MSIEIKNTKLPKSKDNWDDILKKEVTLFHTKITAKRKEQLYSELAILTKSGVSLSKSLEILISGLQKNEEVTIFRALYDSILNGSTFYAALKDHKHFSEYEVQIIKIGEETGNLSYILEDLSIYFKEKIERKRKIINTLTYPLIVMCTSILVVSFMLLYIVPMFEDIFKQNGIELPFITTIILNFSHFIADNFTILILILLLVTLLVFFLKKNGQVKKMFSSLLIKIPFIGDFIVKIYLIRFLQIMNLLTKSKFPLLSGIVMSKDLINFYPLHDTFKTIEHDILLGGRLSESFKKFNIYDRKMVSLIQVAEETNQTEYIFGKLYEQYSKDLEYLSQNLNNFLNPLITIFIGLIVGIVLIAMYLPMFELSSVIQ